MGSRVLGLDDFQMQGELFCQKEFKFLHFKSGLVVVDPFK